MRKGLGIALASLLLVGSARAQVTVTAPGATQGVAARSSEADYGPPRFYDIESLDFMNQSDGTHVLTEGEIGMLEPGRFWTVGRLGTLILLIPARNFDASELDHALGRRIQVRGILRKVRPKEYKTLPDGRKIDLDLIEHPTLPILPEPKHALPRLSITVFALKDRTYDDGKPKKDGPSGGIVRQILDDPASYLGKKSRIYGQFRGRNLFGDLPEGSARTPNDWVLKDGDTAMWVTGKAPKGQGWKLDPTYKGDTKSWMEVEGKPEVVNGIVYLKASFVMMSKSPASSDAPRAPQPTPSPR